MRVAKSNNHNNNNNNNTNNTQHQHAHNNNKAPTAGHHPPVRSNAIAKKQPVPQFNPKNSPVNNLKSHAARAMMSSSPQPKSEQSKPTSSTSMSFPRGNNGKFLPRNNNNGGNKNNNNNDNGGCGDFNNNASNNNNCGNNNNNGQQQPDANVNRSTVLPPPPSFGATFYPSASPGARMF